VKETDPWFDPARSNSTDAVCLPSIAEPEG
jgi:hypothetical protein